LVDHVQPHSANERGGAVFETLGLRQGLGEPLHVPVRRQHVEVPELHLERPEGPLVLRGLVDRVEVDVHVGLYPELTRSRDDEHARTLQVEVIAGVLPTAIFDGEQGAEERFSGFDLRPDRELVRRPCSDPEGGVLRRHRVVLVVVVGVVVVVVDVDVVGVVVVAVVVAQVLVAPGQRHQQADHHHHRDHHQGFHSFPPLFVDFSKS